MRPAVGLFLVLILGCGAAANGSESAQVDSANGGGPLALRVSITGARTQDGSVCVAVFGSDKGFPDGAEAAIRKQCAPLQSRPLVIEGLTPGSSYALSVFLDTNGNGKLDTKKLFGFDVPAEGYGFSNNASGAFGPPSWDDAKFALSPATANAVIALNYL